MTIITNRLISSVNLAVVTAVLLSSQAGCKKGDHADGGAEAAAATNGAIDPKILALAKKAAACKTYETSFDSSCADYKAWSDAKDDFNEGKNDASLVGLLEDPDEKLRLLGAEKLFQYGQGYQTDKALSARVIVAAEKELTKFAGYDVGRVAGSVKVRETGLFDRVKAMIAKHPVERIRRGILSRFLSSNDDNDAVFAVVRDTVNDSEPEVAGAALSSFWGSGYKKPEAVCAVYRANIDNARDELAADASNSLAWTGRCSADYDALLASLEKRANTTGKWSSSSYSSADRHICEDTKASGPQRKRAAAVARKVAETKTGQKAWTRAAALDAVIKCDPKLGPGFVGKFKSDPDKTIQDKVKELLKK